MPILKDDGSYMLCGFWADDDAEAPIWACVGAWHPTIQQPICCTEAIVGCVETHPHWKGQMPSCLSSRMTDPTCSVDTGLMSLKHQPRPGLGPGTLQPSNPSAVLRPLWWKTPQTKRRKSRGHPQIRLRLCPGWVKIHPHWKGQMSSHLSSRMMGPTCSVDFGQMILKHQSRPVLSPGTLQPRSPFAVLKPLRGVWRPTPTGRARCHRAYPQG
nr:uncharacterized protein LOC127488206 [Oryctolagus cuniculus]